MKKIFLLGLLVMGAACAPVAPPRTMYTSPINIGDEYVFTRSYLTECGEFTVDTVKVVDVYLRCVKVKNKRGVEHWTHTKYFRNYITPVVR
jgi:hypothetical protein